MSDRKKSRYAEKKDSGKQMYGPGCCGHSITAGAIEKVKQAARDRRHFAWTPGRELEDQKRQEFWSKKKQEAA